MNQPAKPAAVLSPDSQNTDVLILKTLPVVDYKMTFRDISAVC